MANQTILITGGAGFIGSALAQQLAGSGYAPRIFDVAPPFGESPIIEYVRGDLMNFQDVLHASRDCCGIVHLGGISRESLVRNNPLTSIQTNILGGLHILEAARKHGDAPWVLIGSSRDMPSIAPGSPDCNSLYGISKFTVDMLAKAYVREFGGRVLVTRFADVYGSDYDHPQKVLPIFFRKARNHETIEVHEPDRPFDFIHIDDLLRGLAKSIGCLQSQTSPFFQDITLCTGRRTVLRDLALLIVETLHSSSQVRIRQPPGSAPDSIQTDPAPAFDLLGFKADTVLRDGLRKMALSIAGQSAGTAKENDRTDSRKP